MVAPEVVEERRARIPAIRFDLELMKRIGQHVEGAILENIMRQRQADGSRIRRNAKVTAKIKRRHGWLWRGRVMSLIAKKHRFVKGKGQSWRWRSINRNTEVIIEPVFGELMKLNVWVQEKGFTGWFGLSKKQKAGLRRVLRDWVRDAMRAATTRYRRGGYGEGGGTYRPEFKP